MFLDNEGSIDTSYDEWLAVFRTIVESVIPHKNVAIRPYDHFMNYGRMNGSVRRRAMRINELIINLVNF